MSNYNRFYPAKRYKWTTIPIKVFCEMLVERRNNEKDNIIIVTGARGDGKSTLTGKVLFSFEDFNPYEDIIYSKEAMFREIKKKFGYIWGDEAIISTARGNTMTKANKLLHEMMTINRDNFNIIFLCLPFIDDFDMRILEYASCWIHIDSRGVGVVLLPSNKGIFGKRNWNLDQMKKIFDEFQKENNYGTHVPYWVYENFRGYIRFGKLTVDQKKIVDGIKQLRKNENLERETQEGVVVEVKKFDDYNRYSSKKLAEQIAKGEIRSMKQFEVICEEMKLIPEEILKKCDNIFSKSKVGKTVRGLFREYDKADSLINF